MTADNRYPDAFGQALTAPGQGVFEPTQHDTNELTYVARALIWQADGAVKFTAVDGTTGTLTFTSGTIFDKVQIKQIWDTGTTLANSEMLCVK